MKNTARMLTTNPTAPQMYSHPRGIRRSRSNRSGLGSLGEEDVEEQQRGRDAPHDRHAGVERVEDLVRVALPGAEDEEDQDRDDRCDHGLQDDGVRRNLVLVHLADLVGQALLHAGHEQQPGERVVVDDRRGEEDPRQDQRHEDPDPLAHRETDGLRTAGRAVRAPGLDHDHVPPRGPQVGGHHDDAAPEQVGPDRLLAALHLDAHVQRRLDPEERQDREREERQVRTAARARVCHPGTGTSCGRSSSTKRVLSGATRRRPGRSGRSRPRTRRTGCSRSSG